MLNHPLIFFRELAEALDIDAEGSRPEQSNPVNMPTSLRHGSVPVSNKSKATFKEVYISLKFSYLSFCTCSLTNETLNGFFRC